MADFILSSSAILYCGKDQDSCFDYAAAELARILNRLGCKIEIKETAGKNFIGINTQEKADVPEVRFDGFRIKVNPSGISLSAANSKGILNSVYELSEQFGISFLKPGSEGEFYPEKAWNIPESDLLKNPRFPHRGFFLSTKDCFSAEEHLAFHAKLKFNAVSGHGVKDMDPGFLKKLGLRHESGGHGLPGMLERNRFAEHPEYFRMFQPEDFNGKRMPDSNLCVTNPEVRKIVVDNFAKVVAAKDESFYALHAWADDLPGGGWCMCPSCRSYSSADQNMLGMKLLCRGAEKAHSKIRIPVIAYHDTLFPGKQVKPEKRMFLLWAPRERCYAHKLDDPACERNHQHMLALKEWMDMFKGIDDAHTFEYYLDQLLFTGMYPFLPETLAGDIEVYQKAGIESYMTLQVCSWDIMPDYNGLFFARANWEKGLDRKEFVNWIAPRLAGKDAPAFAEFLNSCADAFQKALIMCGHDMSIYLDYRWLPENNSEFTRKAAAVYKEGSELLAEAGERLKQKITSGRFLKLAQDEIKRVRFEAQEMLSMHYQQSAMCQLGKAQEENDPDAAKRGCELLQKNIEAEKLAAQLAREAGYPDEWHYLTARSPWAVREAEAKLKKYSSFTKV